MKHRTLIFGNGLAPRAGSARRPKTFLIKRATGTANISATTGPSSGSTGPAEAVVATIPWRRRDFEPEKKAVLVVDAATGLRIKNVRAAVVTREKGEIVFQPATVPGDYWIYYLPYRQAGRTNYPQSEYLSPEITADPQWLSLVGKKSWPTIEATAIQSIDEFNSFWPMETIATSAETKSLVAKPTPALPSSFSRKTAGSRSG